MEGTTAIRRVVPMLVVAALLSSVGGWIDATTATTSGDGSVTLTPTSGVAIDAALNARPENLTGGRVEHRAPRTRAPLGLAVLVGLSVLLAVAIATLHRRSPWQRPTVWRRSSVVLRAPPAFSIA